jgi:hypothetical protein
MEQEESVLARVSPEEVRLIRNYRQINEDRQDVLLFFSGELVKNEQAERRNHPSKSNVVLLSGRK